MRAVFRDEPAASPEEIDEPDEPDEPPPPASEDDGVPAPRPSRVKQNKRNVLRDAAVFLLAGALTVSIVIACFRYLPNLQQTQANETAPSRPESDRVEEADGAVFAASEDQPDQPKSAEISSRGELEFEPRSAYSPEYDYIVPSDDLPRDLPSMLGVSEDIAEDYADPDPYPGLVTGAEFEVIASPGAAQFRKR